MLSVADSDQAGAGCRLPMTRDVGARSASPSNSSSSGTIRRIDRRAAERNQPDELASPEKDSQESVYSSSPVSTCSCWSTASPSSPQTASHGSARSRRRSSGSPPGSVPPFPALSRDASSRSRSRSRIRGVIASLPDRRWEAAWEESSAIEIHERARVLANAALSGGRCLLPLNATPIVFP